MISQQSESTSFVGCRTELFAELSLSQTYENEMSEYVFINFVSNESGLI